MAKMRRRTVIGWGRNVDAVGDGADKAERAQSNVENDQATVADAAGAGEEELHYASLAARVAELVQRPRQPERGETEPVPVLEPER